MANPTPAPRLPTKVLEGHTGAVGSVAYFRDGARIISASVDKTVRIWDVESQQQVGESLIHDFRVNSMALSPDERKLVSGGLEGVALWDLKSRTVMWKKEESEANGFCVAYSPDGRLIAARCLRVIKLLNAETGEQVRDPLQFGDRAWCLAFSPDGSRIAAGTSSGDMSVFNVATGEIVIRISREHIAAVMSLVYTPDGQQFITASMNNPIQVRDAATGQIIGNPMRHEGWNRQIALSRDGQRLASASDDRSGGTVRVWDLKTKRQIGGPLQAQDGRDFNSVARSRGGPSIGGPPQVQDGRDFNSVARPRGGKFIPDLKVRDSPSFESVAWSPDGRSIVAGHSSGKIYLWDSPQLDDHPVIPHAPALTTSSPPVLSTSRPRANSISSSILSLPVGPQPLNRTPSADRLPDDFFDSSPDLPGRARNQISTIPIAEVPSRPSTPHTTKPKTGPKIPSAAVSFPRNLFGRVSSRFRRDKHAPGAVEMQPPSPKIPKYSPVGKVALGQADKRLYMDESKDKKPGDEEQEVLEDIDVNCWEIFCAMIESCFSCCRNSDTHPEPPCYVTVTPQPPFHAVPQPTGLASPQSSGHATPTLTGHATPTLSGHATPTSSGHAAPQASGRTTTASSHYAMPTSPGSVAEQLNQNVMWTG
ncbi:WD40-repeat-containing domain protein [Hygrophoropsis aurantiaca]|uniref:WD40-repeat-containing domain protein n=1 Tax=Hygrophoropsis aurantiaca TaxID=72124 RepID=A0ACB7ZQZ6_9AGAM|nr:WD40-repeat-containing domain protein [Hygrophoropsis aurantiaca]